MDKKSMAVVLMLVLLMGSLMPMRTLAAANTASLALTEYVYDDGVSKPQVEMYRVEGKAAAAIRIEFSTNQGGGLTGGTDQIILVFPSQFNLPSNISKDKVTINGQPMTTPSPVVSRQMFLTLSPAMNFPEESAIEIVLAADSGIIVTEDEEDVTLSVVTTRDTRAVASYPFDVAESDDFPYVPSDSLNPAVTVAPNGAGAAGEYTFTAKANTFDTFDSGSLTGFTLTFPSGTVLPGVVDPKYVTVNGQKSSGVLVSPARREMIFTLAAGVSRSSEIVIRISAAAGILNPPAARYVMDILPLKGMKSIPTKPYEIKTISDAVTTVPQTGLSGQKIVKLTLNSSAATKNGETITLDVPATLINGFTLVPVRFVSDGLGASVDYNSSQNTVTLAYGTRIIVLWPGSTIAKVDNTPITLAKAPVVKDGRTLVPIRFVSECFGAKVDFISVTAPITITVDSADIANLPTVEKIQASQITASGGTTASTGSTGSTGSGTSAGGTAAVGVIGKTITLKAGNTTANLRSGPGITYTKVGLLLPNEPAVITEVSGEWYHIRFDYGMEAWVKSDLVDVK
jgi:hypothetical protein